MKKINFFVIFILLVFSLSGCIFFSTKTKRDEQMVFESEDKKIRLEMGFKTSNIGKIYVEKEEKKYLFPVRSMFHGLNMFVYTDFPKKEENIIKLKIEYEKIEKYELNYDIMYLINEEKIFNNLPNKIFNNFNVRLIRNKESKVHPLNYMSNKWVSKENKIEFINNNLENYYYKKIKGVLNNEKIFITFEDDKFKIFNSSNEIKLSGKYKFENLDMVLLPFDIYTTYPKEIVLKFEIIINDYEN